MFIPPTIASISGNEGQNHNGWLTLLEYILNFGGGFASGWFVHWLTVRRGATSRILAVEDEFFDVVAQQRSKLERMQYDEERFFTESIPVLSDAVHKTKRVFRAYRWRCLHRVLQEYQAQDKTEFGKGRERMIASMQGRPSHSKRLHKWLDRFEDATKNAPSA